MSQQTCCGQSQTSETEFVLEQSAWPVSGLNHGEFRKYWCLGPSGVLPGWDGVGGLFGAVWL